jgi:UDP-N-acetylmuramyl tripeptide synthase
MLLGKTARFLLRLVRRGGGSALPGTIAYKIQPNLLTKAIESAPLGLIAVSGTAGKSTTTKAIVELLRAQGLSVFTNPSTANIRQGLYAAVLQFGNWRGAIRADVVVLELDEGHGSALIGSLKPRLTVLTNVLPDQLDRFVDPEYVQEKLARIALASGKVVLNVDDKNLLQIAEGLDVIGYGLARSFEGERPEYAINFSQPAKIQPRYEVQRIEGTSAQISDGDNHYFVKLPAAGTHQALNVAAAIAAVQEIAPSVQQTIEKTLEQMPPVFARDEVVDIQGRTVRLMLVQNFVSFNLNLHNITGTESPLMLMAGSDIHDPSWLWNVDFSKLRRVDVVGGLNAFDLALVLSYNNVEIGKVIQSPQEAADYFLTLPGERPTVLFSADAMRRTRRHLGLAK